jgi:hypothetical protein
MSRTHRAEFNSSIDTASWITLRWVRGTRYYRVHLEQDLWSNWPLTQFNGRVGSPLGRARSHPSCSAVGIMRRQSGQDRSFPYGASS